VSDSLAGRTIVMSGGSRGIGLAILVAAARRDADAVPLAKTDAPDPRLGGGDLSRYGGGDEPTLDLSIDP
jgi:citronellol/citronellal dehydrogenase